MNWLRKFMIGRDGVELPSAIASISYQKLFTRLLKSIL
jgi:hypothetical protein